MVFEGSCIVADPPEYRAPVQTRPVLNVYGANPTATQALLVPTDSNPPPTPQFNVQVRSEDAGEPLRAVFFLDYQMPRRGTQLGEQKLISKTIPAATYEDGNRTIAYTWAPMTSDGCHYLSLVVAHRNSFQQNDEDKLDPVAAVDDAAIVTWTVAVNPPPDGTLVNCPTKDTIP
jgi:hypothetical protein